ncbi:MAG: GNAT family N-acetyltransferase [Magnetococcales bacterium]|nr:GNAT family N-acetyltransferase [Magnetococcales bacterium]
MPEALNSTQWSRWVKPGDRIFIGSNAASPQALVRDLLDHKEVLKDVEMVHILTLGDTPWTRLEYSGHLRVNALFLGTHTREAVRQGMADYTPCFLSEIPSLFLDGILPIDVALIMVSPPDQHGYCSFGVSVDIVSAACRSARRIIAQVNPSMPRTFGQSFIPVDRIDAWMEADAPLPELKPPPLDDVTLRIGQYVAMLIPDGATLQMGIGRIPDAVLSYLGQHRDLGIHTEMFSDGVVDLMQRGVINNRRKSTRPGKSVVTFCMGTRKLYDFVHQNPHIEFHPSEYVNNPSVIASNDRMVAINSAMEVDLTGQVVADSLGDRFYSGIGGQVDFIRGAAMSRQGKPIIALPSTAHHDTVSRIVPFLTEGSGVVTSRGDVHYIVTEYGIATLRGRSIRERAMELIQVAHPAFRDQLLDEMRDHFRVPQRQKDHPVPVEDLGHIEMLKLQLQGTDYFLRPLHPSDERRVQEFFYTYEEDYAHIDGAERMPVERAYALVNVDQKQDLALCIVERQGPHEKIHALGRYALDDDCGDGAAIHLAVRASKRGIGMAATLMEHLIRVARKRGLKFLTGYVTAQNGAMLGLLERFAFVRQVNEHRTIQMTLGLQSAVPE